jgi:hypothetical protein
MDSEITLAKGFGSAADSATAASTEARLPLPAMHPASNI